MQTQIFKQMMMRRSGIQSEESFHNWVIGERLNRQILIASAVTTILLFILFKLLYPHPNFMPDSYSYLERGFSNADANIWPVGYSKFLRFISTFSHSDVFLVLIQYVILQIALGYFLFSIVYWTKPAKVFKNILFIFGVCNPINLHIANFVSSDSLFTALSLTWFAQTLWILNRPTIRLLIYHSILVFLLIAVRFNAIYYPVISVLCIAFTVMPKRQKVLGAIFIFTLVATFCIHTKKEYERLTQTRQLAAFGGWQLASNALYMYSNVTNRGTENVPKDLKRLHHLVFSHLDSLDHVGRRPDSTLGVYYLWDENAPLKLYMYQKWASDTTADFFKKWASVAPLYSKYGTWLIGQHPGPYMKHFLVPNLVNYYCPSVEFLATYNMFKDTVDPIATQWFHYKTNRVASAKMNKRIYITAIYPLLLAGINLAFLLSLAGFLILNGSKHSPKPFKWLLWVLLSFWLANFTFSVVASPIVLRYQIFPMYLAFTGTVLLVDWMILEGRRLKEVEMDEKQRLDINNDKLVLLDKVGM